MCAGTNHFDRGTMMRRRLLLLLVAIPLLLGLALPAAAIASQTYKVKDRSGHVVGALVSADWVKVTVKSRSGKRIGVLLQGAHPSCGVYRGYLSAKQIAWAYLRVLHPASSQRVIGRATRVGDNWVITKRVNGGFRKVGTVPADCYNYFALGAARLLLW